MNNNIDWSMDSDFYYSELLLNTTFPPIEQSANANISHRMPPFKATKKKSTHTHTTDTKNTKKNVLKLNKMKWASRRKEKKMKSDIIISQTYWAIGWCNRYGLLFIWASSTNWLCDWNLANQTAIEHMTKITSENTQPISKNHFTLIDWKTISKLTS